MAQRNAREETAPITTAALFGEVLKHYREAAGLTQAALARQIPCDRSQVARVEAGTRVPQDTFAEKCDQLLGTGGVLPHIWAKVDWYPDVEHPDWFKRRADMDARADAIRLYETHRIPGLLQTEEYMWSLFSLRIPDPEEVEERVRARLSRQTRFLAPGGPLLIAVLEEACLRNLVGSPDVMRRQCAHLLEVGERPNVRVQIAPADRPGARPKTSMSLITLPGEPDCVYSESLNRGHFQDDPALYARHSRAYDVLRADVLSGQGSAALIRDVMKGYGRNGLDQEQLQRGRRGRLHRGGPRYPRSRPRP
ncbi:helix-turn-helix transcriptional regulator [Streptomyces sp. TRM64462]|uniref:helix-turn-helix domain-containing protein n=1 Tax=Streptomyces sp. TRM64462 TaxID=2741726 RepID=UPI0028166667|nr:helix-turn-helix transcriptional regulator [Streptomyces sp. TRM64462]